MSSLAGLKPRHEDIDLDHRLRRHARHRLYATSLPGADASSPRPVPRRIGRARRRPAGCERRRLPGGAGPRAQPQDCTALGRIHAGTMIRAPTEIVRKGPADMRCVIAAADPGRASRLSAGRRRASGSSHRRFCKEVGSDAGWSLWVVTRRSACARQFRGGGCRRHACPDPKQALPTSASRRSDVSACYDRFDRERRFARSHCTAGPDRWRWLAASMPTMSRHQVRCRNHGALDRTATGRRSSPPRLAKQEERSCVFAICCRSSACSRSRPAKTRRRPRPPRLRHLLPARRRQTLRLRQRRRTRLRPTSRSQRALKVAGPVA